MTRHQNCCLAAALGAFALSCGNPARDEVAATAAVTTSSGSSDGGETSSGVGDETGEPGTSTSTATTTDAATGTDADADASSDDGASPKYDVGADDDSEGGTEGAGDCSCGSQLEFSYIWIANSYQHSTVTKLNTQSLEEEGRYLTRADASGSPSRTSVSLSGRAVAVANRKGGVVKVWARPDFCDPNQNGVPGLQTSTGKDDVLPWGEDDCVAWYADFDYATQRPIAWVAGKTDPITCEYEDEKIWTAGCTFTNDPNGTAWAHRLDGDTGAIEDTVEVTGFGCGGFGPYGGAVDIDGNFWISDRNSSSRLARVDAVTLETQVWSIPIRAYGITVDHAGRPWVTGQDEQPATAARFDPETETWALADDHVAPGWSGIQEDPSGRMWVTYWRYDGVVQHGLTHIDADTLAVGPPISIPGFAEGKGISIDLDANVWAIEWVGAAFRFDPVTKQAQSYDGLDSAYTYSDMTGWGLQNAACTPEG